jgi:hypothetical protein
LDKNCLDLFDCLVVDQPGRKIHAPPGGKSAGADAAVYPTFGALAEAIHLDTDDGPDHFADRQPWLGLRALRLVTPDDTVVIIPHLTIWNTSIHNANDGNRELMCVADFYLHPDHDAALVSQKLREVALTSPFTQLELPIKVVVTERPWGTHYRLKAYPIDSRDQFQFISDLTVRGKQALALLGVKAALALLASGNAA